MAVSASAPTSGGLSIIPDYAPGFNLPNQGDVQAIVLHHTGGGGDVGGVINTFEQRGFPAQYVIDQNGNVYQTLPTGMEGYQIVNSNQPGSANTGLNNNNTVGIEIIGANDLAWTPAQIASARALTAQLQQQYGLPPTAVYGHSELNPRDRTDEGAALAQSIRNGTPYNATNPYGVQTAGIPTAPAYTPPAATPPLPHLSPLDTPAATPASAPPSLSTLQTFPIPQGPFGADAIVRDILGNNAGQLSTDVQSALGQITGFLGAGSGDRQAQFTQYLQGLIQGNPILGQAIATKLQNNPDLLSAIPQTYLGQPVRANIQSALNSASIPTPNLPPGQGTTASLPPVTAPVAAPVAAPAAPVPPAGPSPYAGSPYGDNPDYGSILGTLASSLGSGIAGFLPQGSQGSQALPASSGNVFNDLSPDDAKAMSLLLNDIGASAWDPTIGPVLANQWVQQLTNQGPGQMNTAPDTTDSNTNPQVSWDYGFTSPGGTNTTAASAQYAPGASVVPWTAAFNPVGSTNTAPAQAQYAPGASVVPWTAAFNPVGSQDISQAQAPIIGYRDPNSGQFFSSYQDYINSLPEGHPDPAALDAMSKGPLVYTNMPGSSTLGYYYQSDVDAAWAKLANPTAPAPATVAPKPSAPVPVYASVPTPPPVPTGLGGLPYPTLSNASPAAYSGSMGSSNYTYDPTTSQGVYTYVDPTTGQPGGTFDYNSNDQSGGGNWSNSIGNGF